MQYEQAIVAEIRSRLDTETRETIPAPLGTFFWERSAVGVEDLARGRLLSRNAPIDVRIEDLRLATEWLVRFQAQTVVSRSPLSPDDVRAWIEKPLDAYRAAFGTTAEEEALFGRVREQARSLLGTPFVLVRYSVPLSELNICRSGMDLSVTDWEGAAAGPALPSLIFYVTVWHRRSQPDRGDSELSRSVEEIFLRSSGDHLSRHARASLDRYMEALSIDRRFLPGMLVVTWAVRALGRLDRQRAFGERVSDARAGNRHVTSVELLARKRSVLFPGST
jgi:hypothetical protein